MAMMWARKVSRSTIAAARRGSVRVVPHSGKGALLAQAMDAFSSRAVMIQRADAVSESHLGGQFRERHRIAVQKVNSAEHPPLLVSKTL